MVNRSLPLGVPFGLSVNAYRKRGMTTPYSRRVKAGRIRRSFKFYVNNFSFRMFIKLLENLRLILVNYAPKQAEPANAVFNADC